MHIKDPVVHESLVDYGNIKITQYALKVSGQCLHNVEAGHYSEEEEERVLALTTHIS